MATETPRERRQERTRDDILTSALSLVSERGPDKVTVREIARRVDYSPSGLYEYFSGKDEILKALCRQGDDLLRGYLEAVSPDQPVDAYLVALGKAYLVFSRSHREHFQLMFSRQMKENSVHMREAEPDGPYSLVLAAVGRGIDEDVFRVCPGFGLTEIAYGLWSVAHGLACLPVEIPEAEETILTTFLLGLKVPTSSGVEGEPAEAGERATQSERV